MKKLETYGMKLITDVAGELPEVEIPADDVESVHIVNMMAFQTKSFQWLSIAITNAMKGRRVRFRFDRGCKEFEVPNGSVTHGEDGNSSNYNQRFYFCGTDFKEGDAEYNNGRASVFTAPGCVAAQVEITIYKEVIPVEPEKVYPTKYHHTLVGGSDGGVSFVTCPGQIRDYVLVSCGDINMPQHGSSKGALDRENRQGWWNMYEEPDENTDIKCELADGTFHWYKIDKKKVVVYGDC